MLKWILSVVLVVVIGSSAVAYLYGVALRTAGIIEGRLTLKMAAKDYTDHGYVTNYGAKSSQVWLSSNVVSIAGTQYQCFITTTNSKFYGNGSLAVTTNQMFIWLHSKRPPKIVEADYKARLFPPRF